VSVERRAQSLAPFVLVPGAFAGGWLWKRVTPLLRAAGHDVYPVTLTGLGERSHLASTSVGLLTHVQDVVNLLHFEELNGAILVGHSYAGMVISGVADRVPERLARVVYLDAAVPEDGQSYCDLIPELPGCASQDDLYAVDADECVRMLLSGIPSIEETDARWFCALSTPHPRRTITEALRLTSPAVHLPRAYIDCTRAGRESEHEARAAADPGWDYVELDAGNLAMLTEPDALASLLLRLSAEPTTEGTASGSR
jgi:pimeloyl-ACP methyl ester carboxylesterase